MLAGMLAKSGAFVESANDGMSLGLLNDFKKEVMKQQLDNSKCKTDAWKQHISKSKTGG